MKTTSSSSPISSHRTDPIGKPLALQEVEASELRVTDSADLYHHVEVTARPPAVNDKAPAGTKSVVSVLVSDARE